MCAVREEKSPWGNLLQHPVFGRVAQRFLLVLLPRLGVDANHRLGSAQPVADPGTIIENQLQAVRPNNLRHLVRPERLWISLYLLDKFFLHFGRKAEILAIGIKLPNLCEKLLQLLSQALAAHSDHLCNQQPGNHAVFFRNMPANRQPRALFAADHDLVLIDQFADELESHRRLVQRNLEVLRNSIDQVRRCDGLGHSIPPAARLHQIIEQQRNDVIRLDKRAVAIDNSEAISIAIRRNADRCAYLLHLRLAVAQQMIVRLRRMATEQHITVIMSGLGGNTVFAQDVTAIPARRAPEGIENNFDSRFLDRWKIDQLAHPLQVARLDIDLLKLLLRLWPRRDNTVSKPRNGPCDLRRNCRQCGRAGWRRALNAVVHVWAMTRCEIWREACFPIS